VPGKERLQEIVKESVEQARVAGQNLDVAAQQPRGLTVADVEVSRKIAKEAVDKAADACRVIVSEEGG
jgi:hypothetical protein